MKDFIPNDSSCYFLILMTATLLSQIISFISFDRSNNFLQPIFVYNIEALAQDEGYNKGDKLKSVSCTCPNNKSGFSLKCRADGNLEQCTPTRQGSNACYKVKFSTKPLNLICEGSGIKRDANCSARITFFCRLF